MRTLRILLVRNSPRLGWWIVTPQGDASSSRHYAYIREML